MTGLPSVVLLEAGIVDTGAAAGAGIPAVGALATLAAERFLPSPR